MGNLIEGLHIEMNRVRELIKEYDALPNNAGFMGVALMQTQIKIAEKAIEKGDVVAELRAYEALKCCTG